jgi:hypothetical protein
MAARKEQNISLDGTRASNDAVGPCTNLRWHFTSRATVAKQFPVWPLLEDVFRAAALILAVVPLDQVVIDFGHTREAGQFAGPGGALQRAGKYSGKSHSF